MGSSSITCLCPVIPSNLSSINLIVSMRESYRSFFMCIKVSFFSSLIYYAACESFGSASTLAYRKAIFSINHLIVRSPFLSAWAPISFITSNYVAIGSLAVSVIIRDYLIWAEYWNWLVVAYRFFSASLRSNYRHLTYSSFLSRR